MPPASCFTCVDTYLRRQVKAVNLDTDCLMPYDEGLMPYPSVEVEADLLFTLGREAQFTEGYGACSPRRISTQKDSWYRGWGD